MKKLFAVALAMFAVATAQATLVGRDINGNAVAGNAANSVFLYDDVLNVTWLRDANANGLMTWTQASAWAAGLTIGSYSGWRLPTMIASPDATFSYSGGTDYGYNVRTKDGIASQYQAGQTVFSEMAHLWYQTLGNKASCPPGNATCSGAGTPQPGWGLVNTGDFQNLQANIYWSGLTHAPDLSDAWAFYTYEGSQFYGLESNRYRALAVRDGDIASAVPEPQTLALVLLGLGATVVARKKRPQLTLLPSAS